MEARGYAGGIYLIADPAVGGPDWLARVEAALRAGVRAVQYRRKEGTWRRGLEEAASVVSLCRRYGAQVFVDDRVDLALAVGADGVHVGDEDMPASLARRWLPSPKLVGVTAHGLREVYRAVAQGADYLGIGPVFDGSGKGRPAKPVLGLGGLAARVAVSPVPVVAIGGIRAHHVPQVMAAGAAGVAVMRAILQSPDPERAAAEFVKAWGR